MNLDEMATLICTELGVYDETSLALCKGLLSRQYLNLWDKYPWGDAMGYGNRTAAAGVSTINYPTGMDRIKTVRATIGGAVEAPEPPEEPEDPTVPAVNVYKSWFLDPVDSTFLIESEPMIYEERGTVRYYEEIGDASQRQIRLYPIPTRGTTLFFYGKMQCPGLTADTDVPIIRNIIPTLMAYAYFDMLQRQRQYGKADLKRKEAQELEAVAWNLEQQQANQPRRTKSTTVAGNSLAEMTDAVCTICGQWTQEYRLIIREFLRRNYQVLYDLFLWPESLVVVRVPFVTEQVIMPEYVDKVIAVRGADNKRLFSADAGVFMDLEPKFFDLTGDPVGYTTMTPVGVATLPSATTRLVLASTSAIDTSQVMLRGEVLATGIQVEEPLQLNGTTPITSYWHYDIPLTIAKDITFGFVTVNAEVDGANLAQLLPYQRESKHQRLWLLPAPGQSDAYLSEVAGDGPEAPETVIREVLVLAKRSIRPLLIDADTPIITGAQQVLIAAAAADLYRKLEKPDLAAAMLEKASASTDVLKEKNTEQANQPQRTKITTAAGNSLAEMTDAVCTICGQWGLDTRASIAEFMRRSYQTLYDEFLWPESMVIFNVPYTTHNIIIPEFIDKVIAVRGSDDKRLFSADAGIFLDLNPAIFGTVGQPIGYTTLTPIGVEKLPSAATRLVISSTNAADKNRVMLRGEVFATGKEVEEYVILNGTTPVTSYWSYDVPFTVAKDITNGIVTVKAEVDTEVLLTLLPYRREAKHQRLRLLPAPGQGSSLYPGIDTPDDPEVTVVHHALILGKRSIRPLLTDEDTPIITGAQQVLIAAAAASLFQKLEKSDLATAMQQKADAATEALKEKNTEQANQPQRTKITTAAGNTLAEMTDAVCTICDQWGLDTRATIAEFMRRNYQSAYDAFLWPESLIIVRVPFSSEQVVLPEGVDKVLGVRGADNKRLSAGDAGLFLDLEPRFFDLVDIPIGYTTLTPIGVEKLPSAATKLVVSSTSSTDKSRVMLRGEQIDPPKEVEEYIVLNGTTPVTSYWTYDIPLTVSKGITDGLITVKAQVDDQVLVSLLPYRREAKHQRLELLPAPGTGQDYLSEEPGVPDTVLRHALILGKRSIRPLLIDEDTPIITGMQQVLIAGAAADLFTKLEKNDAATTMRQKSDASLEVLKDKNTTQTDQPQRTKITTAAGNSLAEMSDAVCTICGQWGLDTRATIAEFMRRNYQALYDSFLWPESVAAVDVPYTTDNVVVPEFIDKVIAVRGGDDRRLSSEDIGTFLDLSPAFFNTVGQPVGYTTLTPVGVDTLPSATTKLVIASTNPADTSKLMLRGEVFATGTEVEEFVVLNGTTPVTSYWSYDIPFTVAKDITNGVVTVRAQTDNQLLLALLPYRREAKHQRIRLFPAPGQGSSLYPGIDTPDDPEVIVVHHALILGKRSIRPLLIDEDTPIITGCQQVLIAATAANLFQTLEKPDLATSMQQKADAATEALKEKNTEQANQPQRTKITTAAGNSLAEMTDAVCTICGQWGLDTRATIAEFLRRNYQSLYDSYLWPESIVGVRVAYTTGNVVIPEFIDKVVAVRGTTNRRLFPADAGLFMDVSPEIFSEFGDPVGFVTTTPVGVDKLPSETTKLVLASTHPDDRCKVMLRGQVVEYGTEVEEYVTLNGTTSVSSFWSYSIPLTVAKDITLGVVTVRSQVDDELLLGLLPYRREAKHQRLEFLPLPDPRLLGAGETYNCLVIGKRSIRPLLIDEDTPIITGAQQVLIAAAAADLYRKLEKPELATSFQQKAGSAADLLKAKNTDQAANSPRFVPQIEPSAYYHGGVGLCRW